MLPKVGRWRTWMRKVTSMELKCRPMWAMGGIKHVGFTSFCTERLRDAIWLKNSQRCSYDRGLSPHPLFSAIRLLEPVPLTILSTRFHACNYLLELAGTTILLRFIRWDLGLIGEIDNMFIHVDLRFIMAREGTGVDLMSGQDWRSWERCGKDTKG